VTSPKLEGVLTLKDQASAKLQGFSGKLQGVSTKLRSMRGPLLGVAGGLTAMAVVSVKAASDLQESMNAVNVVFGESAKIIHDFGKTSATSVGLSTAAFNQMATQTGALLKGTSLNVQQLGTTTTDLTTRAADLASVFNTDVSDAMSAINQAIRGETEAIRRYSGDVTDNTIKQFALANGIQKSVSEMTQQEKRLLRVRVIMEQTSDKAGDFARTSEDLANKLRITKEQLVDVSGQLGLVLIPVVTKVVGILASIIKAFADLPGPVKTAIIVVGGIAAALAAIGLILPFLISGFTGIIAVFGGLVKIVKLAQIAWAALNVIMALNPFVLIVLAIVGLIAVGVLLWKNWDTVKQKAAQLWNFLVPVFQKGINFIIEMINLFTLGFRKQLEVLLIAVKKVAGVFSDDLANGIQKAIDAISGGIPDVKLATVSIEEMGTSVKTTSEAASGLATSASTASGAISGMGGATVTATASLDGLKDSIAEAQVGIDSYNESTQAYAEIVADIIRNEGERRIATIKTANELRGQEDQLKSLVGIVGNGEEIWQQYKAGQISIAAAIDLASMTLGVQSGILTDNLAAIASNTAAWDRWEFQQTSVGKKLEQFKPTWTEVMNAIRATTDLTFSEIRKVLSQAGEKIGDVSGVIRTFGSVWVSSLSKAGAATKKFLGDANALAAELTRLGVAVPEGLLTPKGERGSELGNQGRLNAFITAQQGHFTHEQNAISRLRDRQGPHASGSQAYQSIQREIDARQAALDSSRASYPERLAAERERLGLAHGVKNFRGGVALVGERGPELVNLPRGADVLSNRQSTALAGTGKGGVAFSLTVNGDINGVDDLRELVIRWIRESISTGGFAGVIERSP